MVKQGKTLIERKVKVKSLSCVQLSVIPWTVAHQAPLSMKFSRQEYWRGLLFPIPGDLPHPRTGLSFLESPALVGRFFTTAPPGKLSMIYQLLFSH